MSFKLIDWEFKDDLDYFMPFIESFIYFLLRKIKKLRVATQLKKSIKSIKANQYEEKLSSLGAACLDLSSELSSDLNKIGARRTTGS
jgi:hypothetical protein